MTLQVGMVGTGWFSKMHGKLLAGMEGVQVSAICGSSKEKADALAADFDNAGSYESIHDMLDARKLDAVYICTPPFAHGEIELALAERNVPFFVEKPLAADLDTPTKILKRVEETQLLTSVGYHCRYMDSTDKALELLQGRTAGVAMGRWMGSMPGVYWWRNQETSGGQMVEQTTHMVDLLRYLLGEVTEVYAAYGQLVMHERETGVTVPDVGTATLKLASGAVATISNTCMLTSGFSNGLQIYTDGNVLDLTGGELKEFVGEQTNEYKNVSNPYERENEAFLHAVRTGDASGIRSTYADAWRTQQVTVAANESARTGLPVKLG
ncbi:gfo/Idh/MocA family oxidoreductase [Paenibacillaceae bacterium]|nr:gfo/Idh/MocA family oxidoreductase [Paenibacillaceae bacterium]